MSGSSDDCSLFIHVLMEDVEDRPMPRKMGNTIHWVKMDEELRLVHEKKVKNSPKPSMWEYNAKGGMPKELANLDPSRFLTRPLEKSLCFLPKDILIRICSMLSVVDFICLSLTCRFLHWKMFTFCTCYVPFPVYMSVFDKRIVEGSWIPTHGVVAEFTYILYPSGHDMVLKARGVPQPFRQYILQENGVRGIFIRQPFCLRKPFFFENLDVLIRLPFHFKQFYDRCLPSILAVRDLARHLNITFANHLSERPDYNYSDTNDFLKAINASSYNDIYLSHSNFNDIEAVSNTKDIFMNCPYTHQMNTVFVAGPGYDKINVPVFENSFGLYTYPLDSAVKATLKNFLTGSANLVLHQYCLLPDRDNGTFPLIEYLLQEFNHFEEFAREHKAEEVNRGYIYFYVWKKVVDTENGGQIRILLEKEIDGGYLTRVTIGREEKFEEMNKKYAYLPPYGKDSIWWKMETAVEPDEAEDSKEDEDEEKTVESDVAGESGELEEQQAASEFCSFCSIL